MEDWYPGLDMYFMMKGTFSAFLHTLTVYFGCLVCLQDISNSSSITLEMADSFLCAKFESGLSESFVERWRKITVKVKVTICNSYLSDKVSFIFHRPSHI